MFAVDLDGDGKNEIVTGQSAHGYGLCYFKVLDAANDKLEKVDIMTADQKTSPVGIAVGQLHAGGHRRYQPRWHSRYRHWQTLVAHGTGDEGSWEPATLVWFETQRSGGRVRFEPHVVDVSAGVGTQVMLTDVNRDKLLDIVSVTNAVRMSSCKSPKVAPVANCSSRATRSINAWPPRAWH